MSIAKIYCCECKKNVQARLTDGAIDQIRAIVGGNISSIDLQIAMTATAAQNNGETK